MNYENADVEFDLGPLEQLLKDPDVTEIMVNGTDAIYVEKHGELTKTELNFESEDAVLRTINSIIEPLGRWISEDAPIVDARLADGSRINAVIRPIALTGPTLTLRKTWNKPLSWDDLIKYGSVSKKPLEFLKACIIAKQNMIISGGTSSGKTTIINALSEFIPDTERIITAEVTAELRLRHGHVVVLETRPPNPNGKGEITMADLITNAQRMRPNRIISGEVRGAEAWDMLQAMTLGYDGSMFTIHATTPQDALERIEMMSTSATNLPLLQIRSKIATGVNIITQQNQLHDGSRKITYITEIIGMKNNVIETRDIFEFVQTGSKDGRIVGEFRLLAKPTFANRLDLPNDFWNLD